MNKKDDSFIKKYYSIVEPYKIPDDKIMEIQRCVWYCNLSGQNMIELESYNANDKFVEKASNTNASSPFTDYLKNGYTKYCVYECGHCCYLVVLLAQIYTKNMREKKRAGEKEPLIGVTSKTADPGDTEINVNVCPMCKGNIKNRKYMYIHLDLSYDNIKNPPLYIPKKYLSSITNDFKNGDIIDCAQYRGTGLRILDGGKFRMFPDEDYYPQITKKITNEHGYYKILKGILKALGGIEFEKIQITENVSLSIFYDLYFYNENINEEDEESYNLINTIKKTINDKIITTHFISKYTNTLPPTVDQETFASSTNVFTSTHIVAVINKDDTFTVHELINDENNNEYFHVPNELFDSAVLNCLMTYEDTRIIIKLNENEDLLLKGKEFYVRNNNKNKIIKIEQP